MMQRRRVLFAIMLLAGVAGTQGCTTLQQTGTGAARGPILSVLNVPDAFPLGSVSLGPLSIEHPQIGALKITLSAAASASDTPTTVTLKDVGYGSSGSNLQSVAFSDTATTAFPLVAAAAPFTGTWKPVEPLSTLASGASSAAGQGGSEGSWVLRIVDLRDASRPINLQSWSLTLCPATSAASTETPALAPAASPAVATIATPAAPAATPDAAASNVTAFSGPSPSSSTPTLPAITPAASEGSTPPASAAPAPASNTSTPALAKPTSTATSPSAAGADSAGEADEPTLLEALLDTLTK
ncbi:hypothetical protein V8C86DRAFT_466761 [Haematococcus lacustris]